MKKFFDYLENDQTGKPIIGATVRVKTQPALGAPADGLATIYTDSNGTPPETEGEVTTDGRGMYRFYAPNGIYTFEFLLNGALLGPPEIDIEVSEDVTAVQLEASDGSEQVGFTQAGTSAPGTVAAKLKQTLSADDAPYNAVGSGLVDDQPATVAAQTALAARSGGELLFTHGRYAFASPAPMHSGITYRGTGSSGIDQVATLPGAQIYPTGGSAAFVNANTVVDGTTTRHAIKFENLFVYGHAGDAGDLFDWSLAGVTGKIEFDGATLIQENADKHIIKGTAAGGVFSIWVHDSDYQYQTANSVSPLNFAAPTINSIVIERTWSTCTTGAASGVPSIHIESTNEAGPAINCITRDSVFELPGGGCVRLLSATNSGVENCAVYDLPAGTVNNPQFEIGQGMRGGVTEDQPCPPSNNCWLKGVRSKVGTSANPDCKIDCSVSGQAGFLIENCSFGYLNGGSATPVPGILILGSDITHFENVAYTRLGASPELDLHFGTTDAGSKEYTIWNGYAGNAPGYLNFYQNGAYIGAFSGGGLFQWGGTRAAPAFYVGQGGVVNTKGAIYPATPALADQATAGIYGGAGAPNNANGANGDFYFRSDGTVAGNTVMYHKEAGSWVAFITT